MRQNASAAALGPLGELTALSAPPDPLAGFGEGECHGKGSVGNGREGERKEGEGKGRAGAPAGFLARVG